MSVDLAITGGLLIDGTGGPARRADLLIAGGEIHAVGAASGEAARQTLDATGCMVAPGFIDAHSHSDTYLLIEPAAPSKVHQGITTEVVGNCGASAVPRLGGARMPSDWASMTYPRPWRTTAEYRAVLEEAGPAVNVALLVGHNTLRAAVMGYEGRAATADEVARMARLLEQALDEGARGLSTGLLYAPGLFAAPDEVRRLAAVVAGHGGVYTTHMRSEGRELVAALDETLAVCRETGVRTEVSHLKTAGRSNWGLLDTVLERMRGAVAEGLPVAADRYPYTYGCTDLDVLFPDWAAAGGRQAVLGRLRDPAVRARLRDELCAAHSEESWGGILIGSTQAPANRAFRGKPLPEVAAALGLEPAEAVLHLCETDELMTSAFFGGMSEANMWRILAEPYVMLGTDASLRAPGAGPLGQDYPHPRAYGSFPRFLRAALDGRTVPVEEAVRKMTGLAAAHFGLGRRGRLEEGWAADVAVFRPERVRDTATYGDPHRLAEGIEHVVVNGVVTLRDGVATGRRGGRFL